MKLSATDPIRGAIEEDITNGSLTIHTETRAIENVIVLSVTEAYIAFDDPDDASASSWVVLPWHQVLSVQYVSPDWVDPK